MWIYESAFLAWIFHERCLAVSLGVIAAWFFEIYRGAAARKSGTCVLEGNVHRIAGRRRSLCAPSRSNVKSNIFWIRVTAGNIKNFLILKPRNRDVWTLRAIQSNPSQTYHLIHISYRLWNQPTFPISRNPFKTVSSNIM